MFGDKPIPDDPCYDGGEPDQQTAKNISALPWVSIPASLQCDQEQREADNGEEAAHEIDALEDCLGRETFCTRVDMRKVREQQSETRDAVVDEGYPWTPSPSMVSTEKLAVHDIWRERKDECC